MNTNHYQIERKAREYAIATYIGYGKPVAQFYINRGTQGGEIHTISDTAIVTVTNPLTGKVITKLIARPSQITRYYEHDEWVNTNKYFGAKLNELKRLAREHQMAGYNEL